MKEYRKASEALKSLLGKKEKISLNDDRIALGEIMTGLHERGFGILMLIFGLPLSIPLPVPPGYTTILGIPLFVLSLQMMGGRREPWLPMWLCSKSVKRSTLALVIEKTAPILAVIEKIMRPRLTGLVSGRLMERLYGVLCLTLSSSIIIPLPLTNFIPASGICLISLGIMGKDGLMAVIGIIMGLLGLAITSMVIFWGSEFVLHLFS